MILKRDYAAHEEFVKPAREKAAFWRFVVGIVLASVVYVGVSQLFFQAVFTFGANNSYIRYAELTSGTNPLSMYLLLISFGFMILGIGLTVRLLHDRSIASLMGPIPLVLRDFRAVSLLLVVIGIVLAVFPPWGMGGAFRLNMPVGQWLVLLPLSLMAVLLQVSAEELVFRGYVQQQLAARFRSPWVWMVLPSIVFALGHYLPNTAGENALMIAIWAGFFGILMADLTARSGSLGPAIAVHFWNNASAMLLVSLPDELSGLALYLTPFSMSDAELLRSWLRVDFAMMIVFWLAARLAIRR